MHLTPGCHGASTGNVTTSPAFRNRIAVTRGAQRWILGPHPIGVEPRPVRAESEPAVHGRMARRAIAFRMAGHARLQTLPRRLAVAEAEVTIRVVIASLAESRSS